MLSSEDGVQLYNRVNIQGCSRQCLKYKAKIVHGTPIYKAGIKRCNSCQVYLQYDGYVCPCCRTKLRTRNRTQKDYDGVRY